MSDVDLWENDGDGIWYQTLPAASYIELLDGNGPKKIRIVRADLDQFDLVVGDLDQLGIYLSLKAAKAAGDAEIEKRNASQEAKLLDEAGIDPARWRFDRDVYSFVHREAETVAIKFPIENARWELVIGDIESDSFYASAADAAEAYLESHNMTIKLYDGTTHVVQQIPPSTVLKGEKLDVLQSLLQSVYERGGRDRLDQVRTALDGLGR